VRCLSQLFEEGLPLVFEIDSGDVLARDHDVVHGDSLEIEDPHQHLLMRPRNHGARLGDDGAQLLAREHGLLGLMVDVDPEQP